jgi:hypothetical protein
MHGMYDSKLQNMCFVFSYTLRSTNLTTAPTLDWECTQNNQKIAVTERVSALPISFKLPSFWSPSPLPPPPPPPQSTIETTTHMWTQRLFWNCRRPVQPSCTLENIFNYSFKIYRPLWVILKVKTFVVLNHFEPSNLGLWITPVQIFRMGGYCKTSAPYIAGDLNGSEN